MLRLMRPRAVCRRPRTTTPAKGHRHYPYLLKGLSITAPNQAWAAGITCIPMARGFMYLVAIMDWHSRCVLSRRPCNTMEADSCVEALAETLVQLKEACGSAAKVAVIPDASAQCFPILGSTC